MNGRSITLLVIFGAILFGWLTYTFWPGGNDLEILVKHQTPRWASAPSAEVMFTFSPPDIELTEVLVERLDEATEKQVGMIMVTSEGPGPVWRLIPQDDREASKPARGIVFARRNDKFKGNIGMRRDRDVDFHSLEPGIRYRVTIRAKGGRVGPAEFTAQPNPKAPPET